MSNELLVLYNGNILTLDRTSSIAEAIAIENGKVLRTGSTSEILESTSNVDSRIDLEGRTVTPGFVDGHPHMDREGLKRRGGIPINGLKSIKEITEVVEDAAKNSRAGDWIILMPLGNPPFDYINRPEQLEELRFPNRYDLDAAAPDNPVYIRSVWGWWSRRPFPSIANSLALKAAGIGRDTQEPYNIEIVKDEKGEPTGVFLEWNYQVTIEYNLFNMIPRFTYEDRLESVRVGSEAYASVGTTALYEGHGLTPTLFRAYREGMEHGYLRQRFYAPVSVPTAVMTDEEIFELMYQLSGFVSDRGIGNEYFRVEGISVDVADPTIAQSIAEGYPYEQWAGHFTQGLSQDRLVRIGIEAARLGLRLNCLVCYNLESVLQAYEAIDKEISIRDRRWVATHLIQATDDQLERIKELGLVVTVGPMFMYMASDRFELDKLGEEGMPLRRWIDSGISIAMETDGVPYSLLWAMWEALARWDGDSGTKLGDSDLSREEALRLICQGGHLLTWEEDRLGSLEAGKLADLVVLSDDPLTCNEDHIKNIAVDMAVVDGKIVYDTSDRGDG